MNEGKHTEYEKLLYPFLHEDGAVNTEQVLAEIQKSTLNKCQEIITLRKKTLEQFGEKLIDTGIAMAETFSKGATLYAFGNGGSSTDAQNVVVDFIHPPYPQWIPLPKAALMPSTNS